MTYMLSLCLKTILIVAFAFARGLGGQRDFTEEKEIQDSKAQLEIKYHAVRAWFAARW
jgi:hypothetical protein